MKMIYIKQKIKIFIEKLPFFLFLYKLLNKILFFNLKLSNYFLNTHEYAKRKDYLNSYPSIIFLNTTNNCNYRCKFCEIHYFYDFAKEKAGKIFSNNIDLDFIKKFEDLFDRALNIELSGASGEPLVNPNFINICRKLKEKNITLTVTTNGSLLDTSMAENLIDMKFDYILVSLHSGEEKNYNELQGGDFYQVIKNLENLVKFRKRKGSNLPKIAINCLIFKLNQHTIKKLIKKMKDIGVDSVNFNHYYACRNKIKGDVSFYFFPKEGNEFLKNIYQYAKSIDFKLTPKIPKLLNLYEDEELHNNTNTCDRPWKRLKLKGCVEFQNSHYICVCNRIILFRLNYKEFDGNFIKDVWNHEIIRYFRKTIMKNPICQFCQNSNTPKLRCINNKQYQIERDKAVLGFLSFTYKMIKIKPRKGIYLLNKNPYEYAGYYEKSSS